MNYKSSHIGTAKIYPKKPYFTKSPPSRLHRLYKKIFGGNDDDEDTTDPWEHDQDVFHIPGRVSLTFFDPERKQFGAIIFTPDQLFSIDPEHHHEEQ